VWCGSCAAAENRNNHEINLDNSLFEGDLKIPPEMILEHYNISSIPEGVDTMSNYTTSSNGSILNPIRNRRAAGNNIKLWPKGIVYSYRISTNVSSSVATNIYSAIATFESNTCLHFKSTTGLGDYIDFISSDTGCYSDSVGRNEGRQVINLDNHGCSYVDIIIHEIGHAIGFWHEQSRPDRDQYVDIHWNFISNGYSNNFLKRKYSEVDYQDSRYDYGSIMHYPKTAFLKDNCSNNSCYTITVNNITEYIQQGSPTLGNLEFSTQDILQVNRLYSCPGRGIRGSLNIKVRQGSSFRNIDGRLNLYVVVTAVDSNGKNVRRQTSYKQGLHNLVWNEKLIFGERNWQFLRISAWKHNTGSDDQLTMSKTVSVKSGNHSSLKNCQDVNCTTYVLYDYYLNSPQNDKLEVYVRYAHNLENTDFIFFFNFPEPYVLITAVNSDNHEQMERTWSIPGTTSPTWNQWIDFGCQRWYSMSVQIFDFVNPDSIMSDKQRINLSIGNHSLIRHVAHGSGYMYYDYRLTVNGDGCASNPCQNEGNCSDGCLSYTCSCRPGYTGTRCEYTIGNKSDPYMEFIAVDINGNTLRRTTRYIQGSHNPTWNTSLSFGRRVWGYLKVQVYDADTYSDNALSSQQTVTLSGPVARSYVRHSCYSGHAVFDYSFN